MKRIFYIIIAMVLVALIATSAYFTLRKLLKTMGAEKIYACEKQAQGRKTQ